MKSHAQTPPPSEKDTRPAPASHPTASRQSRTKHETWLREGPSAPAANYALSSLRGRVKGFQLEQL
jgi:hypothetical protein